MTVVVDDCEGLPVSSGSNHRDRRRSQWYDAQLPGLSFEVLDAIDDAISLILERPEAWQRDGIVATREIRRFVMRRFPFSLVYYVVDDMVRIVAMAHAKRQPRYWSERLRDEF